MTLETFFEKFELLADTPGAVGKMRELILWSAFSGAFSLEERNQPMPADWHVDDAPILPAIPSSWSWQRGRDVFEVIRGVSYKKGDASDCPFDDSFPVLRANNIGNGINFDDLVYVPRSNIRDEQFVRRGDILIAMSSGSKKLVGKAAPIITDFVGAFGAFCGVIRNKSEIPDMVLARYFQTPQYTSWVTAAGRGIGINNLSKGDLDSLPMPMPPLAEQKRIVAKLDELMALCDRLEAQQLERESRNSALVSASLSRFAEAPTPENLQFLFHRSYAVTPADLRKTILTAAVKGRLITQDWRDEPASSLVERIKLEKAKVAARRKVINSPAESEAPFELPTNWRWCRLEDLVWTVGDGPHHSPKYVTKDEGVAFLSTRNITTQGFRLNDVKFVSRSDHSEFCKKIHPEKGDILYTKGGTTGIAIVNDLEFDFSVWVHVAVLKVARPYLFPRYVAVALNSPHCYEQSQRYTHGIGNKDLGLTRMVHITLPLPPLAEQHRIVAKVDQLMALVDQLETQLAASQAAARKLLEAVVAELTSSLTTGER